MTANDTIERHFTLGPRGELSVRNHAGDVSIRCWGGPTVRVRAQAEDDDLVEDAVRFAQTGNHLAITSQHGPFVSEPLNYEIEVPADCRVSVSTVSGEIHLEGTGGGGDIESPAADEIELVDVHGDYRVKTASADLSVEGMRGHLTVQTASGDVEVERSHLSGFQCESVNGDVSVETTLVPHGDYRFKTISGDLELQVPRTAAATVKLQTQSGDAECELPAQIIRSSRRHWEAVLNGGGASVQMESVSGDLSIDESDELGEAPPLPEYEASPMREQGEYAAATASPRESTSILEALARGEIDVDQAMAQLDEPNLSR